MFMSTNAPHPLGRLVTHGNLQKLNEILVTKGDRDRDKSNEMGFDESQFT